MAKPGIVPLSSRIYSGTKSSGMTPAFRSAHTAAGGGRIVTSNRGESPSQTTGSKLISTGKASLPKAKGKG
jgi:hypothetical protein